jgi:hypothetical protein
MDRLTPDPVRDDAWPCDDADVDGDDATVSALDGAGAHT